MDLIEYYNSIPSTTKQEILLIREELKKLNSNFSTDKYGTYLIEAEKLHQKFLILGNLVESYRAKILILKAYVLTSNPAHSAILSDCIYYSNAHNYLFLKAHSLLWKSKSTSAEDTEHELKEVSELAKLLKIKDMEISANHSLAGF